MVICLLVLSIISIQIAYNYYETNSFLSSIFSNIFAGLVTGIAICLISGIKQINIYSIEGKIACLRDTHDDILKFYKHYHDMLQMVNDSTISKEKLYDEIYDVLCDGNNINVIISQSQYNKSLPFNLYEYFVKELKYDAVDYINKNEIIRENIIKINMNTITHKQLIDIFNEMEHSLFILNNTIISKIKELEIKKNILNKFIF